MTKTNSLLKLISGTRTGNLMKEKPHQLLTLCLFLNNSYFLDVEFLASFLKEKKSYGIARQHVQVTQYYIKM